MTKITELSKGLEPSARAFLDAVNSSGGPPIYELSVEDARGVLTGAQAGPIDKLPADIEDLTIPGGPSGEVSIRIVRPKGQASDQLKGLPPTLLITGEFRCKVE